MDKQRIAEAYEAAPVLPWLDGNPDVIRCYNALAAESIHPAREIRHRIDVTEVENAEPYKTAEMFSGHSPVKSFGHRGDGPRTGASRSSGRHHTRAHEKRLRTIRKASQRRNRN
ncbi:hypothetical protein LCGC14_0363940 [marine sediment metagenome]|uniref:Uncharacterized protein n=1 Tax=marine sediment metagenome TaxID=412755 RepID=A0A0F9T739_9ZZZZ